MKKAYSLGLLLTWTLWTRTQTPTSDSWIAAPGLPDQQKCQASINDKLEVWKQFKDSKFGKNSVTFTNNNTTMTYVCLPEDQDPRKAKPGKANGNEKIVVDIGSIHPAHSLSTPARLLAETALHH